MMLEDVVVKEGLRGEDGSADECIGKGMKGPMGERVVYADSSKSFEVTGRLESRSDDMSVLLIGCYRMTGQPRNS